MTANISRNKRTFERAQLTLPGQSKRKHRIPIDPQLIFRQAQLISLKREFRYQFLTGFQFDLLPGNTSTKVAKIVNADGALGGYVKTMPNLSDRNNAIIEKIRWDLAVLAGDQEVHAPTTIFESLFMGKLFASHIQVHEQGCLAWQVHKSQSPFPRLPMLRSLIMTIVYGGFDDHLKNLIFHQNKIIHFDNAGSFSSGKNFIKWEEQYLFSFRPSILMFEIMDKPLLPEEIQFIKKELKKYVDILPLFETYFGRPDVEKLISLVEAGVIDSKKIINGMKERIAAVQDNLDLINPISPRQWIFRSFPLIRAAVALHMVHKDCYTLKVLNYLCYNSLDKVVEKIYTKRGNNPYEVIKIALNNSDMKTIARLLKKLPECSEEEGVKGVKLAISYIHQHSEIEQKNGEIDISDNRSQFLLELCKHKIDVTNDSERIIWNGSQLVVLPNNTVVIKKGIFFLPPLTFPEFIEHAKGNKKESIRKFEEFTDLLIQSELPIGSGTLSAIAKLKIRMLPNTFRLFQERFGNNDRFICIEKDAKGNVYSRQIGYDIGPVLEAKARIAQIKPVLPEHLLGEFYNETGSYKIRPGECAGTYVMQVGKLELAPMYANELQKWTCGEMKELEYLRFLNQLNVQSPQGVFLKEGEHLLVQERESSPMKFTVYQRPMGFPNVVSFSLVGEFSRGLKVITEMGQAFFLNRETFITRLKNGTKLNGEIHAGNRS